MKNQYTAYTREVDGTLFYFVKSFIIIPELQKDNAVLQGFGMHQQFEKACDIAGVMNPEERKQIYATITRQDISAEAKVISLNDFKNSKDKKIS